MGLRTSVKLLIETFLDVATPYYGGTRTSDTPTIIDQVLGSGTTANLADKMVVFTSTVANTNEDKDIRAQTDPYGATVTFAEIVGVLIECSSASTGNLTIKPSASNPWDTLLAISTGNGVTLKPGAKAFFFLPADPAWTADATHKSLNFANSGSSATYTVTLIGRSA